MLYHQSVHNNLKTKRERKHISNLINFFVFQFLIFSLLGRVTLSRSYFIQTNIFFAKRLFLFLITFNMVYFQQPFILDKTPFFWRKRIRHPFFYFIQNETLSYCEKKNGMKNYFLYFFGNWKHIFLFWQESNFSNFNEVMKFIDTTTRKCFLKIFFWQKTTTHVYLLY